MIILIHFCTQNDPKYNTFLMMYLKRLYLLFMLFAKYGRPEAKFGHDTGRCFLIVRGPTLKKLLRKNYER